jgi:ubiquinone biosynthesis protein
MARWTRWATSTTSAASAPTSRGAAIDDQQRRKAVDAALLPLRRTGRRPPPPEGRLGADEDHAIRLRDTLVRLGPVFAGFGRYLASRVDLLPRRTRVELNAIPDEGDSVPFVSVAALIHGELGAPLDRLFFEFQPVPLAVGLWTQRHFGWLSPGVPVTVTIVRPDVDEALGIDAPLLPLLASSLDLAEATVAAAADDYIATLRRRLDQKQHASALSTLAADAKRAGGGFDAPLCYRDYCAGSVLTTERVTGESIEQYAGLADDLANRVVAAWVRQVLCGTIVPYDFDARDIVIAGDRLVLLDAAFESQTAVERERFAAYLGAVAADDPDSALRWMADAFSAPPPDVEGRLRRVLRQAVPFRDGEWSGDDRLAEHALVQWRAAQTVGWAVPVHHQHVYRGLYAADRIANRLAPDRDTMLAALENERLRIGLEQAGRAIDPRLAAATLDRAIQELADLPQKLDDVLTLAAQGRLRMRVQVPEADDTERVRNRTVLLVTSLVAFAAVGAVLRHVVPALGSGAERAGAVLLLLLGGWLLVAAARL